MEHDYIRLEGKYGYVILNRWDWFAAGEPKTEEEYESYLIDKDEREQRALNDYFHSEVGYS